MHVHAKIHTTKVKKFPFPARYPHTIPEIGQSKNKGEGVKLGIFWILDGKPGKWGPEMFKKHGLCWQQGLRGGGGGGTGERY